VGVSRRVLNSSFGERSGEPLYVIKGLTLANRLLYTKGKIAHEPDESGKHREMFYILISCKEATR
jgi:hypothetical protein